MLSWTLMDKRKLYKCSICGAEVPDLLMPVLQHQVSHARRRPYSTSAPKQLVTCQTGPTE
jgi:hypothetical protein